MNKFKYHILNIIAVSLFSYTVSLTATEIIGYSIDSNSKKNFSKSRVLPRKKNNLHIDYDNLLENGFFPNDNEEILAKEIPIISQNIQSTLIKNLTLLGTIYGPQSIARALIKKRGEKQPRIFALKKINNKIDNNVYGNKLIKIETNYVLLQVNGQPVKLNLFIKKKKINNKKNKQNKNYSSITRNISRSEMMQKIKNIDEAMKGLIVSHYRVNGKMVGYRMKKVRNSNILYKFGVRSGDIIKRINGHSINSTEKLMKLWRNVKTETKINLDIERRGNPLKLDYNITD